MVFIKFKLGTVAIWSPDTDSSLREGNSHFASISTFEWSPSGNRLITGDKVWKLLTIGRWCGCLEN
jgi:WD40 repeat protein